MRELDAPRSNGEEARSKCFTWNIWKGCGLYLFTLSFEGQPAVNRSNVEFGASKMFHVEHLCRALLLRLSASVERYA